MDLELTLDAREAQGKANKRLRAVGIVPGVVYGRGEDSTNVQVDAKVFETLYRAAGRTSVVKLHLPGAKGTTSGFIKSVQRHPLSGRAIHVDYLLVNLSVEMEVDVPLVFTGEAPAVEETGGTLLHNLSSVRVKALPGDIPHEISVDVSGLDTLDAAIHVSDLGVDTEKVQILTDAETLVSAVVPPRVEVEEEPVVAEGEEGEGAEEGAEEGEGASESEGGRGEASESGDSSEG
jgi:large subunit ribosomal protein L25